MADDDESVISAVTLAELAYGLDIGDSIQREHRRRRFERVLARLEVIPFGVEEAKLYGVLATLAREAGRNPRPRRLDLQIAATAAAARLPLVTANPRGFIAVDRLVTIIPIA
ncbi:MAG: PIN domain-containing protein [Pseudonocardia sp.]|nr:PIN domain-containing protein [Pseudonocardia sp.]